MTFSTYENYDEHEYFLKFNKIHPILIYSNNLLEIKKKDFQLNLLQKLENKIINKDQLIEIYNNFKNIEIQYKILLDKIEFEHKKIQKTIKESNENILINYLEQNINI